MSTENPTKDIQLLTGQSLLLGKNQAEKPDTLSQANTTIQIKFQQDINGMQYFPVLALPVTYVRVDRAVDISTHRSLQNSMMFSYFGQMFSIIKISGMAPLWLYDTKHSRKHNLDDLFVHMKAGNEGNPVMLDIKANKADYRGFLDSMTTTIDTKHTSLLSYSLAFVGVAKKLI